MIKSREFRHNCIKYTKKSSVIVKLYENAQKTLTFNEEVIIIQIVSIYIA